MWSRKKKKAFGSSGQSNLRRGDAGKERQSEPVAFPMQGLGERANEAYRAPPAVGRDVGDVHGGRAVLQDHDVDPSRPYARERGLGARRGHDGQREGADEQEPVGPGAQERIALTNGNDPALHQPPRVAAPLKRLASPQNQQGGGHYQQPQVGRLTELERVPAGHKRPPLALAHLRAAGARFRPLLTLLRILRDDRL